MSMTHGLLQNECSGKEIRVVTPGVPSFMMTPWLYLQMPSINHKRHMAVCPPWHTASQFISFRHLWAAMLGVQGMAGPLSSEAPLLLYMGRWCWVCRGGAHPHSRHMLSFSLQEAQRRNLTSAQVRSRKASWRSLWPAP